MNEQGGYLAGTVYLKEEGWQDIKKAIHHFQTAAEDGNSYAEYQLGRIYLFGNGVRADREKGLEYLQASAVHGNEYAANLIQTIQQQHTWGVASCAASLIARLGRIFQEQEQKQNAYFYDSAEGLLASVVLLLSEFLPPEAAGGYELRHIASVFKLVQELLMESSSRRGGNQFQELMQLLPADHKAKWLAGSALTASDQGINSIMSTVLSKLNAFLDTELEQVICFDGGIDAELFVRERCAIFLILPEEDATKNFVASLMIQNLARELFSVANEHGGRLPNRAVFFCDELGTMPPFDILPLFSAGRSRRLTLVPIIQSLAQLEKNYGKEGSEILCDNCQDTIFGGFAPNSQTAATLSDNLGSRTVLSGTITKGRNDDSQSLQMMERPLMSPDELKSMPKGSFVVMKTGTHPMKTKLKLFYDWGIRFEKPLEMPDRGSRPVHYAGKTELEQVILKAYPVIHTVPAVETAQTTGLNVKSMPNGVGIKTTL